MSRRYSAGRTVLASRVGRANNLEFPSPASAKAKSKSLGPVAVCSVKETEMEIDRDSCTAIEEEGYRDETAKDTVKDYEGNGRIKNINQRRR